MLFLCKVKKKYKNEKKIICSTSPEILLNDSIKEKAPQVYYAQNRMITAEDYQVVPLSASQEIIKVRSVTRAASGISRAKEIISPSAYDVLLPTEPSSL